MLMLFFPDPPFVGLLTLYKFYPTRRISIGATTSVSNANPSQKRTILIIDSHALFVMMLQVMKGGWRLGELEIGQTNSKLDGLDLK